LELKELVDRYQTAINQVYRRVSLMLKEKIDDDITTDQFPTLQFIAKNQSCTSTDIAYTFGIGKSAVTAQVNRLFDKGLIKRERDEKDRRVVYLSATEKGLDFVANTEKILFEVLAKYLSNFEKEEINTFIQMLERLARIMNED
jgi:DNA-binding MarR family transcriptional regulator